MGIDSSTRYRFLRVRFRILSSVALPADLDGKCTVKRKGTEQKRKEKKGKNGITHGTISDFLDISDLRSRCSTRRVELTPTALQIETIAAIIRNGQPVFRFSGGRRV